MTRILFIGDIMGKSGRKAAARGLKEVVDASSYDLIVANGENAAGGFGLTESVARGLLDLGIHVLTGGNHSFDKKEIIPLMKEDHRILRPDNYPTGVPGTGVWTGPAGNGVRVAVVNLMGRVFMNSLEDPFRWGHELVASLEDKADLVLIDFHAEATSEKVAFGWHMDGKVAAVLGTHTHVQTADARVLGEGTAYITDVGMTGPLDSVIGVRIEDALTRFRLGMPSRFQVAKGNPVFCAVSLELDEQTGRALSIERHWEPLDDFNAVQEEDDE
ncbi:MAG: TIGR00282 family metallophosphoesterase [bacterium]